MTYMSAGGTDSFDTLGLQAVAYATSIGFQDPLPFDQTNPNSFDATAGSNLSSTTLFQLFDRSTHNYQGWISNAYVTSQLNRPNLDGPELIHCIVSDMGDSSHVDSATGTPYDVMKSLDMTAAAFGSRQVVEIKDVEAEAVLFQHFKNLTGFRVRLVDSRFRSLMLPRNCEVNLVLTLWFQQD
jgi:hypothetical protein